MNPTVTKLVTDALVDLAAIAGLVWLMSLGKLPPEFGAAIVASLAGGSLATRALHTVVAGRVARGVPSIPPPSSTLVALLAFAAPAVLAHMRWAAVGLLGASLLVGCGASSSSPSAACTAVRSARAAAELAEPYVCAMPDGGAP